ncbi:MAG: hypothetical protein LUO95_08015 [Methylococcaceae bacterium]|nr:hypothetical protein [Methylococcaceae bacterium]MDD1610536.1 hypothetical protein [Methylococcaceae bacterium]MDD1616288.1 hypothetical protein [Methylococcaceae bacterium]OYV18036.1 MAG: hypothetical protein CG439_1428 [Methylococcaceae bacterium NSP1-2]
MIDFRQINYFSMTYVFIEEEEDIVCEYEQTDPPIEVAADGLSVTFTLKNIDPDEDSEAYLTTLIQKGADDFYLTSTYFENASELYPLSVEISDEEVKFTLTGEDEVMYLYGFFA